MMASPYQSKLCGTKSKSSCNDCCRDIASTSICDKSDSHECIVAFSPIFKCRGSRLSGAGCISTFECIMNKLFGVALKAFIIHILILNALITKAIAKCCSFGTSRQLSLTVGVRVDFKFYVDTWSEGCS